MDDIKTFVALKYQIITNKPDTWNLCETYPLEVISAWAWRCAGDVEHFAKGYVDSEYCIEVAKSYRDGLIGSTALRNAAIENGTTDNVRAYNAAEAATYAAYTAPHRRKSPVAPLDVYTSMALGWRAPAAYAATAAHAASLAHDDTDDKWQLYVGWLIEELCKWELTNENT